MVQERDMLQKALSSLLSSLGTILHSSLIERTLRGIGVQLGRQVWQQYRLVHGLSLPLSKREYGRCLQSLEEQMGWPCELTKEDADKIQFTVVRCPFGQGAAASSDFCWVTSGVFGGVAADQFGYAKVCIERGKGVPPRNCGVTVYIRSTDESAAAAGALYLQGQGCEADLIEKPAKEGPPQRLSPRECEVLRLIGEGLTDKDIAETLNLSVRTVENHGARIRDKLGLSGRTGLIRFALRHRIASL